MEKNIVLKALLVNRRRHLVFPCAVLAAALSFGTAGIATAKQCLVPTIVFTSTNPLDPMGPVADAEIYLADLVEVPDGTERMELTNVRRLTDNYPDGDGLPALSPDGKKIVFDSNRARGPGEPLNTSDLFVMNTDGSEQTFLTRGSSANWSPDGKSIVFHRSASGTELPIRMDPGAPATDSDIFVAKEGDLLEHVEPTNTTFEDPLVRVFINQDPDWSPDGQKIMFTRHDVNDNPAGPVFNYTTAEIWVINADGTGLDRLTFNSVEERSPAWDPDSKRIAYSCREGTQGGNALEICVINVETRVQTKVTDNAVADLGPQWIPSPDGDHKIVFQRPVAGRQQAWVMNADGTGQTRLTGTDLLPGTESTNLFPSWGVVRANCEDD